ncbi:hypothetical protein EST38_g7410 [Candolleomyces aberdarensis]|uniref:HMG box domain-containing protein n=1 Tax=Candolleomyces aberdarensis TaxID=2316362 RepID=A0A4Q2DI16_9AGAR|nr:hypothetical protein EST38_g7410 [Candolleomyces aberdarensis]
MFSYTLPSESIPRDSLSPPGNDAYYRGGFAPQAFTTSGPAWWSSDALPAVRDHSGPQINYSLHHPHPYLRRDHRPAVGKAPKAHLSQRVPRPRNAFMIFRSAFCSEQKVNRDVERDHRHISRIAGHYWNQMPEEEKNVWRRKADQEKVEHEMKHPGYRFCPMARTKKPVKRKVKRNGAEDLLRCKQLADLLISGKEGEELLVAAKTLEPTEPDTTSSSSLNLDSLSIKDKSDDPPFRSPLLPPQSLDAASCTPTSSMESSPTDESFSYRSPRIPPAAAVYGAQHIMVATQSSESVLFQGSVPSPLAYSLYTAQTSTHHSVRAFPLHLPLCIPEQYPLRAVAVHPRSISPFYDTYSPGPIPALPAPLSNPRMAEPVHWNPEFRFTA